MSKQRVLILIDQNREMNVAIRNVLPGREHGWYEWHVLKKAKECLGPLYAKKSNFRTELHKVLNHMLRPDEFKSAWALLLEKYNLKRHPFLNHIYEVRQKLVKPHFKNVLCKNDRHTTQREHTHDVEHICVAELHNEHVHEALHEVAT